MASTVIIGAGIIGCSTAYYLSESASTKAQDIHLVEASSKLFASASGYAGGFLAKDWFAPTVAPLGALSFKLHSELAQKYDGRSKWGYSKSTGNSLTSDDSAVGASGEDWLRDGSSRAQTAGKHEFHEGEGPAWLTRHQGSSLEVISRDDSTAQVEPLKLSQFLLDTCLERGVNLHQPAHALSVSKDARDELASIRIVADDGTETDIPCTRLILTAGAWTPRVFTTLFPSSTTPIPISQLAGHSLVLRSPRWSKEHEGGGCHAIFATEEKGFSPEMFSRMGGEIFIAGLNSSDIPLPDKATDATPSPAALERLRLVATKMLGLPGAEKDDLEVLREGLCFRPVTSSGRPIVSRIADEKLGEGWKTRGGGEGGVFVAGGHGPWGISMSLGTGKVLSEMVEGKGKGEMSANVRSLALS